MEQSQNDERNHFEPCSNGETKYLTKLGTSQHKEDSKWLAAMLHSDQLLGLEKKSLSGLAGKHYKMSSAENIPLSPRRKNQGLWGNNPFVGVLVGRKIERAKPQEHGDYLLGYILFVDSFDLTFHFPRKISVAKPRFAARNTVVCYDLHPGAMRASSPCPVAFFAWQNPDFQGEIATPLRNSNLRPLSPPGMNVFLF